MVPDYSKDCYFDDVLKAKKRSYEILEDYMKAEFLWDTPKLPFKQNIKYKLLIYDPYEGIITPQLWGDHCGGNPSGLPYDMVMKFKKVIGRKGYRLNDVINELKDFDKIYSDSLRFTHLHLIFMYLKLCDYQYVKQAWGGSSGLVYRYEALVEKIHKFNPDVQFSTLNKDIFSYEYISTAPFEKLKLNNPNVFYHEANRLYPDTKFKRHIDMKIFPIIRSHINLNYFL